jgi:hypothetical protein
MQRQQVVSFDDLKKKVTIEQVLSMLGILNDLKKQGEQLRGCCPIHNGSNERQFVVTPSKGVWYCFGDCGAGGDMIDLAARVQGVTVREAALAIHTYAASPAKVPTQAAGTSGPLQSLDYLIADHPLVKQLGITPETAQAFNAGYAPKGIMRGRFAVPIVSETNNLLAYVGIKPGEGDLYPTKFNPYGTVFNAHRVYRSEVLHVTYDPLNVLKAHQRGTTNVIAILGGFTKPNLTTLLAFMARKGIEQTQFF